jgi:hypothetical protein
MVSENKSKKNKDDDILNSPQNTDIYYNAINTEPEKLRNQVKAYTNSIENRINGTNILISNLKPPKHVSLINNTVAKMKTPMVHTQQNTAKFEKLRSQLNSKYNYSNNKRSKKSKKSKKSKRNKRLNIPNTSRKINSIIGPRHLVTNGYNRAKSMMKTVDNTSRYLSKRGYNIANETLDVVGKKSKTVGYTSRYLANHLAKRGNNIANETWDAVGKKSKAVKNAAIGVILSPLKITKIIDNASKISTNSVAIAKKTKTILNISIISMIIIIIITALVILKNIIYN